MKFALLWLALFLIFLYGEAPDPGYERLWLAAAGVAATFLTFVAWLIKRFF